MREKQKATVFSLRPLLSFRTDIISVLQSERMEV